MGLNDLVHPHPAADAAEPGPVPPAAAPSVWEVAARAHARWRAGHPASFDDLVRTLTPTLWHAARSYGLAADVARDVVQNAWLTLVRKPGQVRDSQAIGGWLLTTTRRLAWRAAESREIPVQEWAPHLHGRAPSPEDAAIAGFEARALWEAVAALDPRCQRLLRVIAFDDRPNYAALAAETGMPVGSIGPTRRRCLDKVRARLEGASS